MTISRQLWHKHEGSEIFLYTLDSGRTTVKVSNLGCVVQGILVNGKNVVLSYETAEEYLNDSYYIGCIIGRYAGRIANASYEIDGVKYQLSKNEQPAGNHLHGGFRALNKVIFEVKEEVVKNNSAIITFGTTSADGEEGHPGEVNIEVTFALSSDGTISTRYVAKSTKATHLNLTHHHYFNLAGGNEPAVFQQAQIYSNYYLQSNNEYIPDGNSVAVKNSNFDFVSFRSIKKNEKDECVNVYYQLNEHDFNTPVARLYSPLAGIEMEMKTTYPCIVLYSGDFLDKPFEKSAGVCLETQLFPDSPNHPHFPSTLLRPGTTYDHETTMLFKAT